MSVTETILEEVRASAGSKLTRALRKRRYYEAAQAIRELVEASLPYQRMPNNRIDTIYRKRGTPHVAWKWVTKKGMIALVVEASHEWDRLVVTALLTYPGLSKCAQTVYKNEVEDVSLMPSVVDQLARALRVHGL